MQRRLYAAGSLQVMEMLILSTAFAVLTRTMLSGDCENVLSGSVALSRERKHDLCIMSVDLWDFRVTIFIGYHSTSL